LKKVAAQGSLSFTGELNGYSTDSDHITVYERADGNPVKVRRDDKQFLMAKLHNPERRPVVMVKAEGGVAYAFGRKASDGTLEVDPDAPPALSAFTETPPDPVDKPVQFASAGQVKARTSKRRRGSRGRRK